MIGFTRAGSYALDATAVDRYHSRRIHQGQEWPISDICFTEAFPEMQSIFED